MLGATSVKRKRLAAWLMLSLAALPGPAQAQANPPPGPVAVQYRLLTEFTGSESVGGRIVVALTNQSAHALTKVTVRLADATVGKLTGPVQQSIELAAGETRQLEGEFMLDVAVVNAARPLDWLIVATEPAGFAQQTLVRGELLHGASTDADTRTAAH